MDSIKISKVQDVTLIRLGISSKGQLHLTTHHMIFREADTNREIWICYPMIFEAERKPYSSLFGHSCIRLRCRDFNFLALNINSERDSVAVFESIMKLTCVGSVDKLYAFIYKPGSMEKIHNGWKLYDPVGEFNRMGSFTNGKWRVTMVNKDYQFCPSYPAVLVVPDNISDNVLNYASKFRSKCRIPALTYYHKFNDSTITRCSQPMVGLKQTRSVQDEKSVLAIFTTTQTPDAVGALQENLIIDARPTANAMAQTALGAGSENMENYKFAKKIYLGIDNIHVMRESLNKVVEALKNGDFSPVPPNPEILHKSHWLKHSSLILEGARTIAHQVHYRFSHVLIHCSDGWDRTSQLSSLAQIMLDPYYRTFQGFMLLIEKDWLSFGYRFAERTGFLLNEKCFITHNDKNSSQAQHVFNTVSNRIAKQTAGTKYTSPVFHQFLDCVYQIMRQFPDRFEFNERFLRRLLYHVYSGQYGTFLYNSERERVEAKAAKRTRSAWDYFLARRSQFINSNYVAANEGDSTASEQAILLTLNVKDIKWWPELFGRTEQEMNRDKLYPSDFMTTSTDDNNYITEDNNGDDNIVVGDALRDLRLSSPRYESSQVNSPRASSPMTDPNQLAIHKIAGFESQRKQTNSIDTSVGLKGTDNSATADGHSPRYDSLHSDSSRLQISNKSDIEVKDTSDNNDQDGTEPPSMSQDIEPLGNTMVTYDHDEGVNYSRRLRPKFESMALDTEYHTT